MISTSKFFEPITSFMQVLIFFGGSCLLTGFVSLWGTSIASDLLTNYLKMVHGFSPYGGRTTSASYSDPWGYRTRWKSEASPALNLVSITCSKFIAEKKLWTCLPTINIPYLFISLSKPLTGVVVTIRYTFRGQRVVGSYEPNMNYSSKVGTVSRCLLSFICLEVNSRIIVETKRCCLFR